MKTRQSDLQKRVHDKLLHEPGLDSSRIGVYVDRGVVALSGYVHSLVERHLAEQAARRAAGVDAIANELQVDLLPNTRRDDVSIAQAVRDALHWNVQAPEHALKVTVSNGCVTLAGTVQTDLQRLAAKEVTGQLEGVISVVDRIGVHPTIDARRVKRQLAAALHRNATREAGDIEIETHGGEIILRGTVPSWSERDRVQEAAWSIPGVTAVDNLLAVQA